MKLNSNRLILAVATVSKMILAVLIAKYYWETQELEGITQLPFYLLGMAVAYILLQMLTRRISSAQHWWDWVYYLGLLSIILPVTFANESNQNIFHWLTDLGIVLMILPVIVDGWLLIKTNSTEE